MLGCIEDYHSGVYGSDLRRYKESEVNFMEFLLLEKSGSRQINAGIASSNRFASLISDSLYIPLRVTWRERHLSKFGPN